jgi:Phage integrase family
MGLPDIRFHDLRHTCATLLLTKGVHPKIVSEMLGHSSIALRSTPIPSAARGGEGRIGVAGRIVLGSGTGFVKLGRLSRRKRIT